MPFQLAMMPSTIALCKFVGTVSLGLLTVRISPIQPLGRPTV